MTTHIADVTYWLNDAIAPGNLRLGSSLVSLGLSWKAALGLIAMGNFLIAIAITTNGIVGARYGIGYPVQSRAPFGFFFSYLMVVVRMVVGVFWYGVNTYTGAECIYAVLVAIWPSFATMPNQLPASANITTKMMICKYTTCDHSVLRLMRTSVLHVLHADTSIPLHPSAEDEMVFLLQEYPMSLGDCRYAGLGLWCHQWRSAHTCLPDSRYCQWVGLHMGFHEWSQCKSPFILQSRKIH